MSASTRGDISLVNKLLREAPHIINGMNHVRIVKLIVPTGADMCSQDGRTPLMAASGAGQVDMVCLLLERGADVGLMNDVSMLAYIFCLLLLVWLRCIVVFCCGSSIRNAERCAGSEYSRIILTCRD